MHFTHAVPLIGFPGDSKSKESACHARGPSSIPGSGRSPGEGNGYSVQYSCLENPMDRVAWRVTVDGISKSRTERLTLSLLLIGSIPHFPHSYSLLPFQGCRSWAPTQISPHCLPPPGPAWDSFVDLRYFVQTSIKADVMTVLVL